MSVVAGDVIKDNLRRGEMTSIDEQSLVKFFPVDYAFCPLCFNVLNMQTGCIKKYCVFDNKILQIVTAQLNLNSTSTRVGATT